MKRCMVCPFAVAAVLALSQAAEARPLGSAPAATQLSLARSPGDVVVDGKKIGNVQLVADGQLSLPKLGSGHRVTLRMQNGRAVSAQALDGAGNTVPVEVNNNVARKVIVIIIRTPGRVIVIIIRTRS